MKTVNKILGLFFLLAFLVTRAISPPVGSLGMAVIPVAAPILNEYAEKEMIKKFRHDNSWLNEITSKNQWVNNDVIKIPKQGAAPNVIINNNIYPIVKNDREDSHVTLSLNKYETENTIVTDDELYANPLEKVSDVQVQHREELEDKTAEHALYSLAPADNTDNSILETTGADDGTGRLRLTSIDLINLKKKLDKNNIPGAGRVLVLCPDHGGDLLIEDKAFLARYQNTEQGTLIGTFYGFKIYEATYSPKYAPTALTKLAFDSIATGREATVLFHKRSTAQATGSVTRYMQAAQDSPTMRENVIGFRLWFICVAFRPEGMGAIVSGKA